MDNMDYATSNLVGAMAAVVIAFILTYLLIELRKPYYGRLLYREGAQTCLSKCCYSITACLVCVCDCLRLERTSEKKKFMLRKKLKQRLDAMDEADDWSKIDAASPSIVLEKEEEQVLVETLVSAEDPNIWALLMPAAYMLVPGSMIAKMWFNIIFPPINEFSIVEVNSTIADYHYKQQFDNVFSNLMVISTSLALGLILGFAVVQIGYQMICAFCCCKCCKSDISRKRTESAESLTEDEKDELAAMDMREACARDRVLGMFTVPHVDPKDEESGATKALLGMFEDGQAGQSAHDTRVATMQSASAV